MKIDLIEVDSFKIRIPLYEVEIIDDSIRGAWVLVNEVTGIIDEADFKRNSISYNINGIKTKFALEKQTTANQSIENYLIILVNAKTLGKKYFEGITKLNVKRVYKYIIGLKVANFSFKAFLDSEITDVDFKRDRFQNNFRDAIDVLYELAKPTKELGKGCRKFKRKNNEGIQFSDRRTTAITSAPFIKIYNKEVELKRYSQASILFYTSYLRDIPEIDKLIKKRIRVEYTIKNKKHFRLFNIDKTNLECILNLSQKTKKEMLVSIIGKHLNIFEPDTLPIKNIDNLTPTEIVLISMIQLLVEYDMPVAAIIEKAVSRVKVKTRKSEMRIRLFKLFSKYNMDDPKCRQITKTPLDFLKWLLD